MILYTLKTSKVIANIIGRSPQPDGKTLFLNVLLAYLIKSVDINWCTIRNFTPID